jgi:hypothetical protein
MILDSNLAFDGPTFQAITTTRDSTNTLDMSVQRDMGIGDNDLYLAIVTDKNFAGGTSVTIAFQGSADNSTWTVYAQSPALSTAQLNNGNYVFPIVLPRPPAGSVARPRYYKLTYTVSGTYTAGAVMAYLSPWRDDNVYYPTNINVANI